MKHCPQYKETEIGYIPNDWDIASLSDIGTFTKGNGISRAQARSGKIPCIRYGEIYTSHDNYIREFYSHISPEIASIAKKLKKGDILFAASGETKEDIGKAVAFVGSEEAYAGGDIIILSPQKHISSLFLGFVLNNSESVRQKSSMGQGDAVVHIHAAELSKVLVPLPDYAEQYAIADALKAIDSYILALTSLIKKKCLIKQGTMQNLLSGRIRLCGFNSDWIEIELGDIGKLTGAGVDKTINDGEKSVRLVNFLDVYNRDKIFSYNLNMWVTASDYKIQRCDVKCGDIFLTPSSELPNDIGRSAVAMADINDACYSYHILRLRPTIELDLNYSAYMFKTEQFEEQVRFLSEGSGKRYVISLKNFREMRVTIPSDLKEQEAIGKVICSMDNEITALKAERDKYIQLKQGMMQKLLTGQIRLPKSCLKQE